MARLSRCFRFFLAILCKPPITCNHFRQSLEHLCHLKVARLGFIQVAHMGVGITTTFALGQRLILPALIQQVVTALQIWMIGLPHLEAEKCCLPPVTSLLLLMGMGGEPIIITFLLSKCRSKLVMLFCVDNCLATLLVNMISAVGQTETMYTLPPALMVPKSMLMVIKKQMEQCLMGGRSKRVLFHMPVQLKAQMVMCVGIPIIHLIALFLRQIT